MATIKAPYNFVPLESEAFYPEWANHISQDIPFEDGVSGSIEYTLTAETPIFVRNGQAKNANDNTFSHTADGRYFIPGTSIKGEIRNVLEILSFGKMTQVQDARFGIRDLNNKEYRKQLHNVHCGWLYKVKEGIYRIVDCGTPYWISPESIDSNYHTKLKDFKFHFKNKTDKDNEEFIRSANYKFKMFGLDLKYNSGHPDCMDIISSKLHVRFNYNTDKYDRNIAKINNSGTLGGTIIFTGQPNRRQQKSDSRNNGKLKWVGKYYEFIFPDSTDYKDVDKHVIEDFLTIHDKNYDFTTIWKDNLNFGNRIPVFFTLKNNRVNAIGLSYMFRTPSANYIKGAIPSELQSERHKDLSECIFGTADTILGQLKGRVIFENAFAINTAHECKTVPTTLSSPKPSFGPLYVKGGSWNSSNAIIKGRKRYPVRKRPIQRPPTSEATKTEFTPLKEGVMFSGKIHFHNLKKSELGALVSALTFNGHPKCYHSIGEAKPLGYGKVAIKIKSITDIANSDNTNISKISCMEKEKYYLDAFRKLMIAHYDRWEDSASIRELIAMAKGIDGKERLFDYLKMDTSRDGNEFRKVKEHKENLNYFTEILSGHTNSKIQYDDWKMVFRTDKEHEIHKLDKERDLKNHVQIKVGQSGFFLKRNNFQNIEAAFNDVVLASIPAFAGRIKNWKRDCGIGVLNEDQLNFLGNFIRLSLDTLKKEQKKSWDNKGKWDSGFKDILEQKDIDYLFSIVKSD